MKDGEKTIYPKDVYDGLWERRSLGINLLWTRLTMLGTFMAKGSKAWFELYEAAIDNFQENSGFFESPSDEGSMLEYLNFKSPQMRRFRKSVDLDLLSSNGGRFSVSKIPIVMGQMSLVGWIAVVVMHFCCLLMGEAYILQVMAELGLGIAVLAVLAVSLGVSAICHRSRSGFL